MARRHAAVTGKGLPYLVAEEEGRLLGYAYAGPFRERSAYRFTVEDFDLSRPGGLPARASGGRCSTRLIAESTAWGARQMLAVIGDSGNAGSIGLHTSLGFRHVGTNDGGRLQVRALGRHRDDAARRSVRGATTTAA